MTLRYDTFALTAVFCIALMIAPLSQCSYYVLHPAKSQTQGSMQPLTEPLSVSDAAFVYDSESDRAILYGGWHSTANAVPAYYNETWSFDFDTNSWENLNLSINPGLRSGHSSAYDSDADMMLIYGGALSQDPDGSGFQYMDDTWGFDYNSNMWTNLSPSINPGVRYGAAMAFDSESNVIILFGGINYPALFGHHIQQTWVYHFDTNNWTNMDPDQQPVGRHKQGMVYDSESDRIIMFGGFVSSAEDQMSDETWTYDYNSNTWTEIVPTTSPAGRFGCSMAYDSQNDRTILYGGAYDYANYSELHDTWSFNLNTDTWTRMTGDPHPLERWKHSLAYDEESDRILLFGGSSENVTTGISRVDASWAYEYTSDSWTNLDGKFESQGLGPPLNLFISKEGDVVVLSWEPPRDDTGYAITAYNIYRGTVSGELGILSEVPDVLAFVDFTAQSGFTYYYAVSAETVNGEGELSIEAALNVEIPPLVAPEMIIGIVIIVAILLLLILQLKRRRTRTTAE